MSSKLRQLPEDYTSLLGEVKKRVRAAQYQALKAVNKELVGLYWDIGRMIVDRQSGDTWGKAVVQQLAHDLQGEFPGVSGFSASNLWRMKAFFETYSCSEKLAPLVREIGWSHNLTILEQCSDALEREFYIRMTRKFGWSKNVLIHQIENQSYEKTLLGQTNFDQALTPELRAQAKLAIKDEYTFDFLELGEEHSERELERAFIGRIEDFLRAMGGLVGSPAGTKNRRNRLASSLHCLSGETASHTGPHTKDPVRGPVAAGVRGTSRSTSRGTSRESYFAGMRQASPLIGGNRSGTRA